MARWQSPLPAFILVMCCAGLAMVWNVTSVACVDAPVPAALEVYYEPLEAEAIHSIMRSWIASGSNLSANLPEWSLDTHPCQWQDPPPYEYLGESHLRPIQVNCHTNIVHIGNRTVSEYTLTQLLIGSYMLDNARVLPMELVGDLPNAILNLSNLEALYITGYRGLSGPLPIGLTDMNVLKNLNLRGCNFSGSILESGWEHFEHLDLSDNLFNKIGYFCSKPDPAQNISGYVGASLRALNLSNNLISGNYCSQHFIFLESIDISNNKFNDVSIQFSPRLKSIAAQHNQIERFPMELLLQPELQEIHLDYNIISGILILPNISLMNSSLRHISLTNNNITGLQLSNIDSSLLSDSNLRNQRLLFLGGNPLCKNSHKSELLRSVCCFNISSPLNDMYHKPSKIPTIIISSISCVVLVALIITLFVIANLLKRILAMRQIQNELDKKDVKPYLYSYTELKCATQDFHAKNELGRGGFGVVYKGILADGSKVAVKRLSKINGEQEIQDFLKEIIVISGIKHRNLVQLKGCCIKGDQRILVYELVENENLAQTFWGKGSKDKCVDWETRFNIILGIARGLAYLHEEVQPSIVHRDIKGPNILLDKDLNPKIADFGLALFFPALDDGKTHMSVSKVGGTLGYLSPEYASFGQVSTKLDVFSFGVLLLEIVSGRKNIDFKLPSSQQFLCQWAERLHKNQQLLELIDKSMQEAMMTMAEESTIKRVVEVGLLCLDNVAARRPHMSEVVAMLLGNKIINQRPFEDYFQVAQTSLDVGTSNDRTKDFLLFDVGKVIEECRTS